MLNLFWIFPNPHRITITHTGSNINIDPQQYLAKCPFASHNTTFGRHQQAIEESSITNL